MKQRQNQVRKLALAYRTGWEYVPDDKEAGSVLTDIFLDMMEENQKRFQGIWEKQELEFLSAVPLEQEEPALLKSALCIKTTGTGNARLLPQGSRAYMTLDDGSLLWFSTSDSIELTAASLQYVFYEKGLYAWRVWEENHAIPLFVPSGQELSHPVFKWRFSNLCNGLKQSRFIVEFSKEGNDDGSDGGSAGKVPTGIWSITDSQNSYSLKLEDTPDGAILSGDTPEFAGNLQDTEYEIILDIPEEKENNSNFDIFKNTILLKESSVTLDAELCLTEDGAQNGGRVLPFGYFPDDAACCYFACDRALARERGELTLKFTESCEKEEKLPPEKTKEIEKIYKKYPWLKQTEEIYNWKPRETVWEYFNGKLWCRLPGSSQWNTGCMGEESLEKKIQRCFRWQRPKDMMSCSIDGEEHFFIRLRAVRVDNPYAAYYRKYIPVLENICFAAEEAAWRCIEQDIPELSKIGRERMYLGFDYAITSENRWYAEYLSGDQKGSGRFSFHEKQIAGWEKRFGQNAFWVELAPEELQEALGIPPEAAEMEFTANYVEILQIPDSEESAPAQGQKKEILQGTIFHVETKEMGVLDAVSVIDTYYNKFGAPCQAGRKTAENFFIHYGRLLTPMDVESLFEERYPGFRVLSCRFEKESNELIVEITAQDSFADEALEDSKFKEVQEWLENTAHRRGSLWLKDCHVKIHFHRQGEEKNFSPERRVKNA